MWKPTPKEKEAVLKLGPSERYTYTLKRIADLEVVFSLQQEDGNWALSKLENQVLFSIWPHADFAQSVAESEWSDCRVAKISLKEFITSLLPSLGDSLLINVFGIDSTSGFVVTQQELLRDLGEELTRY